MSKNRIRVLLLAPNGAGTHYNGAGTTFYRMYSHPANKNMQVSLLHGDLRQEDDDVYHDCHFLRPAGGSLLGRLAFARQASQWIKRNRDRFDVIHSITGFYEGLRPAYSAQQIGLPAIVTVAGHRSDLGGNAAGLSKLLRSPEKRQKMAAKVAAMIATSNDIHTELLEAGVPSDNIKRIPYGIDTVVFSPAEPSKRATRKEELGLNPDVLTIAFVGDCVRRKRPKLILEAMAKLASKGQACQILMIGPTSDTEYANQIKQLASEQNLEKHIVWAGMQTNVAHFLSAADVFALPSQGEGLPNAMLEAMGAGLPAIGTKISGISDLIRDGETGYIVDPTSESVADRLSMMIARRDLVQRMGENARSLITANYSIKSTLEKYEQLFRSVSG